MITYTEGNFFDYEADIRVNTVNCVGVMGAGAALQFKKKYPKMYEDYVKECNAGRVRIGLPHVWTNSDLFIDKRITIINFPTKEHWKNPSEYCFIEKGLSWLKEYLSSKGKVKITLPALGCGHGGLDWSIVRNLIERYLGKLEANILVFAPTSSTNAPLSRESIELLNRKNINRILPGDNNYPKTLKDRSATEIYIKGNSEIFNKKILSIIVDPKAEEKERMAVFRCIDSLPKDKFVFCLGFSSSFEIDIVKRILECNSQIIIVLPYGILELKIRQDLSTVWDENLITLVSLSSPTQTWKPSESINALKFRIKIPNAILLSYYNSDLIRKLVEKLDKTRITVFYINYWEKPNPIYESINAIQIGRDRFSNLPNTSLIVEHLSGYFLINREEIRLTPLEETRIKLEKIASIYNTIFYLENINRDDLTHQLLFEVYNALGQTISQPILLHRNRIAKFTLTPTDNFYLQEFLFIRIKSLSQLPVTISLSILESNSRK